MKGQVVAIEAPGFMEVHYHHEADIHPEYVIPRTDCVLLGSTTERDAWSTETEPHTVEGIYKKCVALVPRLAGSKIVGSWGCLRPVRHPEVRVEMEEGGGGLGTPIIHCYGHGGTRVHTALGDSDGGGKYGGSLSADEWSEYKVLKAVINVMCVLVYLLAGDTASSELHMYGNVLLLFYNLMVSQCS